MSATNAPQPSLGEGIRPHAICWGIRWRVWGRVCDGTCKLAAEQHGAANVDVARTYLYIYTDRGAVRGYAGDGSERRLKENVSGGGGGREVGEVKRVATKCYKLDDDGGSDVMGNQALTLSTIVFIWRSIEASS
jgi:hypothetical protein